MSLTRNKFKKTPRPYFSVQAAVQLHQRSFGLLRQLAQNLHPDLRWNTRGTSGCDHFLHLLLLQHQGDRLTSLLMVAGFSTDIIMSAASELSRMLVTSAHRVFSTCLAMCTWVSSARQEGIRLKYRGCVLTWSRQDETPSAELTGEELGALLEEPDVVVQVGDLLLQLPHALLLVGPRRRAAGRHEDRAQHLLVGFAQRPAQRRAGRSGDVLSLVFLTFFSSKKSIMVSSSVNMCRCCYQPCCCTLWWKVEICWRLGDSSVLAGSIASV